MKVALIGATGFVGHAVLGELLQRGHQVVALMRDPVKLADAAQLTKVEADVLDLAQVERALTGVDAVISAYNPGWTNPNIYDEFLLGARNIERATKHNGIARLIVVGGAGSLYGDDGKQLIDSPQFPKPIYNGANAARDYLVELQQATSLDWTFLSPPVAFAPGGVTGRKGVYRVGSDKPLSTNGGLGVISPEDLAVAIVDELERPQHIRQRFTVAY